MHLLKQYIGAKTMDISNIARVYNGKCGCMCGCNGKYTYNENVPHEDWQGEVNVRSVKIMAKKILTNPNVVFDEGGEIAYVEDRQRNKNMVIFFKTPHKV
jgi:hypothetical protein